MSNKATKTPKHEDYLTREEYRARFDAEKALVQRHYCTVFEFWRTCRFKPCRKARACKGDQDACLKRSVDEVPRHAQFQARQKLLQATPRNMGAPERAAHELLPNGFCDPARPADFVVSPPAGWRRSSKRG